MIYRLNIFPVLVTINYILFEKCLHNCVKVRRTSLRQQEWKMSNFIINNNDKR